MIRIPLTQGKFAIIDAEDRPLISNYKWYALRQAGFYWYAITPLKITTEKRSVLAMHRLILKAQPGFFVDHINSDGLDNRRQNLRLCTHAENMRNRRKLTPRSSKFKGVSFITSYQKWRAQIKLNGRDKNLGYFRDEAEAARTYDRAALKYFGEFARLNFPNGQVSSEF